MNRMTLALLAMLVISPGFAEVPKAPGAELKLVAADYKFTEGPAADGEGNVYFTDQPNDRIMKWSAASGKVETFMKPAGRANGLFFDGDGKLIACADEKGELWRIDVGTKKVDVLVDDYEGKVLNGPNDVWVDAEGGMYFSDPFYKRDYWTGRDKPDQEKQRLYYLAKGAKAPVVADESLKQPNGVIGSPDGKHLFVADIGDRKTYKFEIGEGGKLAGRKLFCESGSDGMALDENGNIYLTGNGVLVYGPDGRKLGDIPVDKGWTANVCFGGKEMKTLFITALDSVFTLEMAVEGARFAGGAK